MKFIYIYFVQQYDNRQFLFPLKDLEFVEIIYENQCEKIKIKSVNDFFQGYIQEYAFMNEIRDFIKNTNPFLYIYIYNDHLDAKKDRNLHLKHKTDHEPL